MRVTRRLTAIMTAALASSLYAQSPRGDDVRLLDAVKQGDHAAISQLLGGTVNVNVNIAAPDGTTALHWAAERADVETATRLVAGGANVRAANRYGVTPLSLACITGNAAMITVLLEAGADPNTALPEGETALMTAA